MVQHKGTTTPSPSPIPARTAAAAAAAAVAPTYHFHGDRAGAVVCLDLYFPGVLDIDLREGGACVVRRYRLGFIVHEVRQLFRGGAAVLTVVFDAKVLIMKYNQVNEI